MDGSSLMLHSEFRSFTPKETNYLKNRTLQTPFRASRGTWAFSRPKGRPYSEFACSSYSGDKSH